MAKDNRIEFGTLHPDGTVTNVRSIKQSDIGACPHFIMVAEHYRENGVCRCDDATATVMSEWGYVWDSGKGMWDVPPTWWDGE